MTVEKKSRIRGVTDDIKTAKLFLIDLAGSERAAQTQVRHVDNNLRGGVPRHSASGMEFIVIDTSSSLFETLTRLRLPEIDIECSSVHKFA